MFRLKNPLMVLFGFILIVAVSSCSDPDNIGLDLQPTSEIPIVGIQDTFDIQSYTRPEDSLLMYGTYKNSLEVPTLFLGHLEDQTYIGSSSGRFVSQIRVGNTINPGGMSAFGGVISPDSTILSFAYKGFVGDTSTSMHHIYVYELLESLSTDSLYYSGRNYAHSLNPIGELANFHPNFKDSVNVGGVNVAPQLRIPLDQSFGDRIMTEEITNSTNLEAANFKTYMKGIVVYDSVVGTPGCMMTLVSNSSINRMTLYYKVGGNPTKYEFIIDGNCVRSSFFQHNYITAYLDSSQDDPIVAQSIAGLKTKIKIVNLEKLYAHGKVSINSAKLTFKVKSGTITAGIFDQHPSLLILGSDSLGKNTTIIDEFEPASYYGGTFDINTQTYTFNIARYLQQTLTKVVEQGRKDYGLYLVASGSTSNAQRTILDGGSSIKLIVTYTKVNP